MAASGNCKFQKPIFRNAGKYINIFHTKVKFSTKFTFIMKVIKNKVFSAISNKSAFRKLTMEIGKILTRKFARIEHIYLPKGRKCGSGIMSDLRNLSNWQLFSVKLCQKTFLAAGILSNHCRL